MVHAFGGDRFSNHGVENLTWTSVYDFVESPSKAPVIEIFSGHIFAEEVLAIFVLEEVGQSIHRLSFDEEIHDQACGEQSRRHRSLLFNPLNTLINHFDQTTLLLDRVNHGKWAGCKFLQPGHYDWYENLEIHGSVEKSEW